MNIITRKTESQWELAVWRRELSTALHDDLGAGDVVGHGREVQGEGTYMSVCVYMDICLIHVTVWQKSTQHDKAIILQVKILKILN